MTTNTKLDRIDIRILSELQKNGRITNVDLADKVNLSPSPCLKRVKKLEDADYIISYGAHIDLAKLGDYVTVFTEFTLNQHFQHNFHEFEKTLRNYSEVVECHLISGGYDYLVKFIVKGISNYQDIINQLLANEMMIKEYFSYIVIKTPIENREISLETIFSN
jgi:DNA-binding Lrp family transcriptional regulator